jgi:hypothetical protein
MHTCHMTGGPVSKSPRNSIEAVADALGSAKDDVWDRAFEIAKPEKAAKAKRKGRATKAVAALGVIGGVAVLLVKKRDEATAVAKTAADKGSAVAKTAAEKSSVAAKGATDKGKVVGADLKTKLASATESIKARTKR